MQCRIFSNTLLENFPLRSFNSFYECIADWQTNKISAVAYGSHVIYLFHLQLHSTIRIIIRRNKVCSTGNKDKLM